MRKKLMTALAPLVALVAIMAAPAIAQAEVRLEAPAGTTLSRGTPLLGIAESLNFQTNFGTVECPNVWLGGSITRTGAEAKEKKEDLAEAKIDSWAVYGSNGICSVTDGWGTKAKISSLVGLPWSQKFYPEGWDELTGSGGEIGFNFLVSFLGFEIPVSLTNETMGATYTLNPSEKVSDPLDASLESGGFEQGGYISAGDFAFTSNGRDAVARHMP